MAIFEQETSRSGDAATRALSVTTVGTDFVEKVYQNIAQVYDYTYGPTLHPGRLEAIKKMRIRPGTEVLEVGVGTGINLALYPKHVRASPASICRARCSRRRRSASTRRTSITATSSRWTRRSCQFADNSFDVVYAPYVISVVPDPVAVAREMYRVCRPGGRVVILNHFKSANALMSKFETAISPMTVHIGFTADLDLPEFLEQADLHAGVDREGERPEDLDAHHGRERLDGARSSALQHARLQHDEQSLTPRRPLVPRGLFMFARRWTLRPSTRRSVASNDRFRLDRQHRQEGDRDRGGHHLVAVHPADRAHRFVERRGHGAAVDVARRAQRFRSEPGFRVEVGFDRASESRRAGHDRRRRETCLGATERARRVPSRVQGLRSGRSSKDVQQDISRDFGAVGRPV